MKVGILGGGQLARMMAQAGIPLGCEFVFLDPKADACAGQLGELVVAEWEDASALDRLSACDRITCDFENVPATVLERLADAGHPVRPAANAFAAAQDRLTEKRLFESLDIEVAPFAPVSGRTDLLDALDRIGYPALLKTRRMGYDGKGQYLLRTPEDLEPAWAELGDHELILEGWVDFDFECAITVVRNAEGEMRCYPLSRTVHADGMLRLAAAPANVDAGLRERAEACGRLLAEHLDYVGCLTLELFVAGDRILGNEFAPRVHNSAHWTIEGAVCSQFENHIRAVCDLPLGATALRAPALMFNWIGAMPSTDALLNVPDLHWHDYGKQSRPGRKVGHATLLAETWPALVPVALELKEDLPQPLDRLLDKLVSI
ncbi:5-(carboxyamino)imidazole ribonucleotide synthase [Wenzhouxiangella sediminis]|uniref:N5-carboxyaminoimidazole ribonucleotide synthase n=1 Tax=Wenzhouxiangella sediminis TaxID=1792836 RepID=A0A3E1K5W0_9GAMM|nr:5-(carboxyamino)imidazole ribonucleotide synthase [Wenzhouxiangella sediminis]RFF29330.1 5-(carboxyamino)imidazole ribonucleotide synthase [Wenzhouxiangella sediminis]